MTETIPSEESLKTSFLHFIEQSKNTQAGIIESCLLFFMGRHDLLKARSTEIETLSKLFVTHLQAQPPAGYEVILEDIRANPNPAERSQQLLQMEQLIAAINSGILSLETLTHLKAKLDERKQRDLATRSGIIRQRTRDLENFATQNHALLNQLKIAFNKDLEKLKNYRDEETISKWIIELPLLTETAATTEQSINSLPLLADVIRQYHAFTSAIKEEEITYLRGSINLLTTNRNKLIDLLAAQQKHFLFQRKSAHSTMQ